MLKQQHELEAASKQELPNTLTANDPSSSASNRQVGMKSKLEEDDDGTEWEEAPVAGNLCLSNVIRAHLGSIKFICAFYKCMLGKNKKNIFTLCNFLTVLLYS